MWTVCQYNKYKLSQKDLAYAKLILICYSEQVIV